jgi:hypothetical protein
MWTSCTNCLISKIWALFSPFLTCWLEKIITYILPTQKKADQFTAGAKPLTSSWPYSYRRNIEYPLLGNLHNFLLMKWRRQTRGYVKKGKISFEVLKHFCAYIFRDVCWRIFPYLQRMNNIACVCLIHILRQERHLCLIAGRNL